MAELRVGPTPLGTGTSTVRLFYGLMISTVVLMFHLRISSFTRTVVLSYKVHLYRAAQCLFCVRGSDCRILDSWAGYFPWVVWRSKRSTPFLAHTARYSLGGLVLTQINLHIDRNWIGFGLAPCLVLNFQCCTQKSRGVCLPAGGSKRCKESPVLRRLQQ